MRLHALAHLLPAAILLRLSTAAIHIPAFQAFTSAVPQIARDFFAAASAENSTLANSDELVKRASGDNCPSYYSNCASLGAAAVCCVQGTTCAADFAGHVACCPSGAVCTGVITGIITAGTVDASGGVVTATATASTSGGAVYATPITTTTSANYGAQTTTTAVQAGGGGGALTGTTNSGFIVAGSNTVATIGGRAARGAEIPLIAHLIVRALDYITL